MDRDWRGRSLNHFYCALLTAQKHHGHMAIHVQRLGQRQILGIVLGADLQGRGKAQCSRGRRSQTVRSDSSSSSESGATNVEGNIYLLCLSG